MKNEIKVPYTGPNPDAMFIGRNGAFNQHGLSLFARRLNVVLLEPIRKNGQVGRCGMDIPVQDIPAVIAALQTLYDQHAPASTSVPELEQPEVDGSEPVFTLHLNKIYLTRKGERVKMVEDHGLEDSLPFSAIHENGELAGYYTRNGRFGRSDYKEPNPNDIAVEDVVTSTVASQVEQPEEDGPKPLLIKVGRNYRLKNGYIAHIDGRDFTKWPTHPFFTILSPDKTLYFNEMGANLIRYTDLYISEEVPTPKFEVGKKYVNRNLDVTTITYITETVNGNPLILHGYNKDNVCETWQPDGKFAAWQTSVLDLVDEYHEQ